MQIYDHLIRVHDKTDLRAVRPGIFGLVPEMSRMFDRFGQDAAISNMPEKQVFRRVSDVVVSMMFFVNFGPSDLETAAEDACLKGLRVVARMNDVSFELAARFVCGASGRVVEVPGDLREVHVPADQHLSLMVVCSEEVLLHLNGAVREHGMSGPIIPGSPSMNRAVRVICEAEFR